MRADRSRRYVDQSAAITSSLANMAALAGASELTTSTATAMTTAITYSAVNKVYGQTPAMVSGYPVTKCLRAQGYRAVRERKRHSGAAASDRAAALWEFVRDVEQGSHGDGHSWRVGRQRVIGRCHHHNHTTASMNDTDSSCSVSGATRISCVLAGARTLLTAFQPSTAYVGLMVFPGVQNSTQAAKDYACPGSNPTTVAYNATPDYLIVGLSNDYRTSNSATTLNPSSNLAKAVDGVPGCNGLAAVGGFGTYYADVITAAQATLTTTGRAGVQKVIVFLSDGDANATSANVGNSKAASQCHQGITAAQTATAAGTWVFTAAYGSPTAATPSSCSTDTSSPISACTTMQTMASTSAKFFAIPWEEAVAALRTSTHPPI